MFDHVTDNFEQRVQVCLRKLHHILDRMFLFFLGGLSCTL